MKLTAKEAGAHSKPVQGRDLLLIGISLELEDEEV